MLYLKHFLQFVNIIIIKTIFHQGAQLTNSDFQRGPELDKVLSK